MILPSLTSVSGSIFAIYTSLLWFITILSNRIRALKILQNRPMKSHSGVGIMRK